MTPLFTPTQRVGCFPPDPTMQALSAEILPGPRRKLLPFGPRGTGKSTWLREHLAPDVWLDLLDPELAQRLAAHPGRLREILAVHPGATTVASTKSSESRNCSRWHTRSWRTNGESASS